MFRHLISRLKTKNKYTSQITNLFFLFMHRFLNSLNIQTGSHMKQRSVAKSLYGDGWQVEEAPFMFKDVNNFEVNVIPWARVENLSNHVLARLDSLQQYV